MKNFTPIGNDGALKPVHTKTATVAEKCDRRFLRQSHFYATLAVFCDSVDRALGFFVSGRLNKKNKMKNKTSSVHGVTRYLIQKLKKKLKMKSLTYFQRH